MEIMKQVKCEMNTVVANIFLEAVHEEVIPVNVNTGMEWKEPNGETMIDMLLEFDESDETIINQALNKAVNDSIELFQTKPES
jgi:hypothetical protein